MYPHNRIKNTADMISIGICSVVGITVLMLVSVFEVIKPTWIIGLAMAIGFVIFSVAVHLTTFAAARGWRYNRLKKWIEEYARELPGLEQKSLKQLEDFVNSNNRRFKEFGFERGINTVNYSYYSLVDHKKMPYVQYKDLAIKTEVKNREVITCVTEKGKVVAEMGGSDYSVKPGKWLFVIDELFRNIDKGDYPLELKEYETAKKAMIKKIR